jgi:hypothetical protein
MRDKTEPADGYLQILSSNDGSLVPEGHFGAVAFVRCLLSASTSTGILIRSKCTAGAGKSVLACAPLGLISYMY